LSVGNETPLSDPRLRFMRELVSTARRLDASRLISAASNVTKRAQDANDQRSVGAELDVLAVTNTSAVRGLADRPDGVVWKTSYDKRS